MTWSAIRKREPTGTCSWKKDAAQSCKMAKLAQQLLGFGKVLRPALERHAGIQSLAVVICSGDQWKDFSMLFHCSVECPV